jgi:hypothetical protein
MISGHSMTTHRQRQGSYYTQPSWGVGIIAIEAAHCIPFGPLSTAKLIKRLSRDQNREAVGKKLQAKINSLREIWSGSFRSLNVVN